MADGKRQTIMMTCAIVACIVTLITCGTLIGGAKSDISNMAAGISEISQSQKAITGRVVTIETDSAFQKGVVQTQLKTQGLAIVRIEKKLDDLIRVD
jgi:low affinity Fe/Cu permease